MGGKSIVKLFLTFCKSHRGFTRQPENSKRAHLRVPAFKNTTKIPREDPQREKKSENGSGRRKKGRNFGRSSGGGPRRPMSRRPVSRRVGPRTVGSEGWRFEGCRPKTRKSGAPKGGVPKGGERKIWCYFFLLPPLFSFCRVKPWRLLGLRGFTRHSENSKRAHLRVPAFNHTTKIPRNDFQERKTE